MASALCFQRITQRIELLKSNTGHKFSFFSVFFFKLGVKLVSEEVELDV